MLPEMEGKRISVVVPRKEVVRIKKVIKSGPRSVPKEVWAIDFRGIRNTNCVERNRKKQRYRGQKAAFNSPEKLKKAINAYFESCYGFMYDKNGNMKYDKNGEPIRYQKKPFTVSGLAYGIGVSTATLNRYCEGNFDVDMYDDPHLKKFRDILIRAKQKIESYAESRLYDRDGNYGAKFVLDSSFGWCTQREQAEIQERHFNMWLREKEFDLKKQLAAMGEDTSGLEIRIVRKGEE